MKETWFIGMRDASKSIFDTVVGQQGGQPIAIVVLVNLNMVMQQNDVAVVLLLVVSLNLDHFADDFSFGALFECKLEL
jgi:hypothetical protein